jgi:riboflavin-specific deaminase-like protein
MNTAARRSASRPFLFVNMAMSADGKIATANREVSSFGSPRDHGHLLELRAGADAVMAGARTVDTADVNMGPGPERYRRLRVRKGLAEFNLRVIVSRSGSINPDAEVFRHGFSPIIILTTKAAPGERLERLKQLTPHVRLCGESEIDWRETLAWLSAEWGVQRLLCEGGGELNDALFRAGLVDELHLTICPIIIGGRTAPTICDGLGAPALTEAARLELKSRRLEGNELFLVYRNPLVRPQSAVRRARASRRAGSGR